MVAPAAAAAAQNPRVHSDSNAPDYEELHKSVWKQMQKVTARWPKVKTTANLCIDRALTQCGEEHKPAAEQFDKLKDLLNDGNNMYKVLEDMRVEVMIIGKKYHSKDRLIKCSGICTNLRQSFREITIEIRALQLDRRVYLDSS